MDFDRGRRRFLRVAGAGTAASLAGCNDLRAQTGDGTDGDGTADAGATGTDADDGTDGDGTATVTLAVQADDEAVRRRQEAIRSALRDGNISRTEAQRRARRARRELLAEAVAAFRDRADGDDGLRVLDAVDSVGAFLVSGAPTTLVRALDAPEVSALLPAASFSDARSQAGTRATPTPEPN